MNHSPLQGEQALVPPRKNPGPVSKTSDPGAFRCGDIDTLPAKSASPTPPRGQLRRHLAVSSPSLLKRLLFDVQQRLEICNRRESPGAIRLQLEAEAIELGYLLRLAEEQ